MQSIELVEVERISKEVSLNVLIKWLLPLKYNFQS